MNSASTNHSPTQAPQEFQITAPEDVEIGSAGATKISFSTPFKGLEDSRLTVDTYSITRAGDVGTDSETWAVRSGDVKFNLALSNWHWCGDGAECSKGQKSQVGAFIDVVISVKGSGEPKVGSDGNSVELGGGATIELSNRVFVDGEWTTMPEGFPAVDTQGSSTKFTFRFPKFSESALYDPVVSSGDIEPLLTADERDTLIEQNATAAPDDNGDGGGDGSGGENGDNVDVDSPCTLDGQCASGSHRRGNRPLTLAVAVAVAAAGLSP